MKAVGCSKENLFFCGAGKFLIEAKSLTDEQRQALLIEQHRMIEWLLGETNGQLRLALTVGESGDTPQSLYENTMQALQREKLRAWAEPSPHESRWRPNLLILPQLDKPCALCERRTGSIKETDDTGETRLVCRRCHEDLEMGKDLPKTNWIALSETGAGIFHFPGWKVALNQMQPAANYDWLLHLTNSETDVESNEGRVIKRALARHIPRGGEQRPIEFSDLAKKAQGDNLLAVLKSDADSLGEYFNQRLSGANDFTPLQWASREMDGFFGVRLDKEISKPDWWDIYTIFAGGDDLLLVGPWNVIFDFAARANQMFREQFGGRGLTLSAGLSFLKPKQPIKRAVEQAEELLHQAKTKAAPRASAAKDQFSAFGQIWKWSDHAAITQHAKQLTDWVNDGNAQRGWLQTLLRLAEWRQLKEDSKARPIDRMIGAMATSRLVYFVTRNFPGKSDRNPEKRQLQQWADALIDDFDVANNVETIYLSTIVRYALTATRTVNSED